MERVISSIKNTISKSVTGPHQLTMEELFTWENMVIDKLNNCPLILGTPLRITLTPNCVLQGLRLCYCGEINPDALVQHQLFRWKIILHLFNSLWEQEYNRWGVIFKNETIYCHQISTDRVEAHRKNRDVYVIN